LLERTTRQRVRFIVKARAVGRAKIFIHPPCVMNALRVALSVFLKVMINKISPKVNSALNVETMAGPATIEI
jgi:hypothetical protein